MTPYPVTPALRAAIESLFERPSTALGTLGVDAGGERDYGGRVDPSIPLPARLTALRRTSEGYLTDMAAEARETGCPEATDTLRMQAVGILLSLRELHRHTADA